MTTHRMIGSAVALATVLVVAPALSDPFVPVPPMMNYQGFLTGPGNLPPNGDFPMTFRIYPDSTGSDSLWTEAHASVTVARGIFNVLLGSVNPLPSALFDGRTPWLETTVRDVVLQPRRPLVTVPYAFHAETALHAQNADTADVVREGGSELWGTDGTNVFRSTGNVGVGTASPTMPLTVKSYSNAPQLRLEQNNAADGWTLFADSGDGPLRIARVGTDRPGEKVMISAEGKVGVGTANPTEQLQVAGTIYAALGGMKFPDGTLQTTAAQNLGLGSILDYGTSTQSGTPRSEAQLKLCYGKARTTEGNMVTITGLPFSSASSYVVVATRSQAGYATQAVSTHVLSGSSFRILDFTPDADVAWFALGI